jgi:hypothetical protein
LAKRILPSPEKLEVTMNRELLNDEELSIVAGGKPPGGHGNGTGGGTGTGGGDGLGWLRNLIRNIFPF